MEIYYLHGFIEELEQLDRGIQNQIKKKLKELYRLPFEQQDPVALKGSQFKGLYKYRMGDWRMIYKIVGRELYFVTLGHRSEIYKT